MPLTPQISLIATLQDVEGNLDPNAYLRITLAYFGGLLPRVAGTSMIARAQQKVVQTGAFIEVPIWGNDVITPAGTFYCIEIVDSKGNIVQSGNYQLTGSGTQDLSTLNPYNPPPPNPLPPSPTGAVLLNPPLQALQIINGSIKIIGNLTVTGLINGGAPNSPYIVTPGPAPVFDGNNGSGFKLTLNQNAAPVFQNMAGKQLVTVRVVQPASGPTYTFTWPASVRNAGPINPNNGARSTQLLTVDSDGTMDAAAPIQYS